jgi:hypothetical protein
MRCSARGSPTVRRKAVSGRATPNEKAVPVNALTVGAVARVDQLRGLSDLIADFAAVATASLWEFHHDHLLVMQRTDAFLISPRRCSKREGTDPGQHLSQNDRADETTTARIAASRRPHRPIPLIAQQRECGRVDISGYHRPSDREPQVKGESSGLHQCPDRHHRREPRRAGRQHEGETRSWAHAQAD